MGFPMVSWRLGDSPWGLPSELNPVLQKIEDTAMTLHEAAKRGDVQAVQTFLDKKKPLDSQVTPGDGGDGDQSSLGKLWFIMVYIWGIMGEITPKWPKFEGEWINLTLCSISPEASATSLLQCVFPRGFWDCGKVSISAVLQVQMMLLTAAATQPTNFGCLATSRLIQHVCCSNCGCIFEIFEMLSYDSIVKHFLFSFTLPSCRMGWWGEWTWNKLWSVLSRDRSVNWSASHLLYHSYIKLVIYSTRRFQHSSMRATFGINPLSYGFQLSTHKPGCTCKHIRVWGWYDRPTKHGRFQILNKICGFIWYIHDYTCICVCVYIRIYIYIYNWPIPFTFSWVWQRNADMFPNNVILVMGLPTLQTTPLLKTPPLSTQMINVWVWIIHFFLQWGYMCMSNASPDPYGVRITIGFPIQHERELGWFWSPPF